RSAASDAAADLSAGRSRGLRASGSCATTRHAAGDGAGQPVQGSAEHQSTDARRARTTVDGVSVMTCSHARDAMLIAERSALRGDDDSGLSQHIQECESCRRLAAMIENETAVLAAAVRREPAKQDSRSLTRQRTRNALLRTVIPI